MEKKMKAKSDMLKLLSKEMSDDQYSPLKDQLAGKKLEKVTVMADSKKGLEKGLSKAEEILKKRDSMMSPELEDKSEESDDSEEESCEGCEEGCPMCEDSEEESDSEESDMSEEEIMDMMKSLEAKLAKMKK